jgi:hypothetical protein
MEQENKSSPKTVLQRLQLIGEGIIPNEDRIYDIRTALGFSYMNPIQRDGHLRWLTSKNTSTVRDSSPDQ